MKAKVLKYAKDGNTLVMPHKELTKLKDFENVYTYVDRDDYFGLVFAYRNSTVFVCTGTYRLDVIENNINSLTSIYETYPDRWKDSKWVQTLQIELNKLLGNDIEPIVKKREEALKERDEANLAKQKEREAAAESARIARIEKAVKTKNILKNGEAVTWGEIISAIDATAFVVHPRTKGAMLKQNQNGIISKTTGNFTKKTSQSTATSLFECVNNFINS